MHTSQQQPDFTLLPTPAGIPQANVPQQLRGNSFSQSSSQDANMDDASYPSSQDEGSPMKEIRNLNLNALKMRSKITKDGLPAKKRGPKRDSKPAMNRRQELNRQAQRTHRERKEIYTKSLEIEVTRRREIYEHMVNVHIPDLERRLKAAQKQLEESNAENLIHENERLKQLLQVNGIAYDRILPVAPPQPVQAQQPQASFADSHSLPNNRLSPAHANCNHNHDRTQHSLQPIQQFDFNTQPVEETQAYQPPPPPVTMSMPPQASQRTLSNSNMSSDSVSPSLASTHASTHASNQGGFMHVNYPHSISGSSFGDSPPQTISSRHSPSFPDALSRQTTQPDTGTIDTLITNGSSSLSTPLSQEYGPTAANGGSIQMANMDHDQVGIDFILAMEENCRDHQQYLVKRANPAAGDMNVELSGHAMMMTHPMPSQLKAEPEKPHHEPPAIPSKYLSILAETSLGIPLKGGEVVPAQALRIIRADERYNYMNRQQFDLVTERLRSRSRCYGFGAVVEAFEVRDAMEAAFSGELIQEVIGEAR